MSKEMVISSNRHETKVAVLEEDQLVEVYFQRQNEYSLAGSIHKGRVTRVLPGMQSAFVDLGLERDTFLYVSDFFEDNEEYDKISGTAVEERPARTRAEEPAPPPAAAPPASPERPPAQPVASERPDGGDPRDRRGRRSRRRRNRGGRGFPESKYASAVLPPEPVAEGDSFAVLPGESFAKYSRAEGAGPEEPLEAAPGEPDEDLSLILEQVEALDSPAPCEATESSQAAAPPQAKPILETRWDEDEEEAALSEVSPEIEPEAPAGPPPEAEPEATALAAPEAPEPPELEDLPEPPAGEAAGEEPEALALESEGGDAEPAAEQEQLQEPEGVEPARIPQSLTATLREHGGRYLHLQRTSRRARRKPRGGGHSEGWGESERPPETTEARREEPRESPRPAPKPDKLQPGSITELLKEGQEILVQIAKEPMGQKGARITSHIALPGRYVVYMPTIDHMGVSRKISTDEERLRLKRILLAHRSSIPGGFIVRTAGEGKSESEIAADMSYLLNLWLEIRQKAEQKTAPALIFHDLEIVQRTLRDQFNESFKAVWVDSEEVYESVLRFVQRFQPALLNRVKLYTRPTPIFDAFNVTAELEKALRPKVWLKSGGYIVINQTEALVAIDVNTGKYVGKSNRLEDTIVKTNTEAVREIVRQVRLRDLGGIIVVDFIDMDERKNRMKVMQALEEAMRADRAPYKILQFNDFGLVAITRKRVKQSLERTLCMPCPHCEGAGYVKSVTTVVGEIIQEAAKIADSLEGKDVILRVHPDVAKALKSHQNHYLEELEETLRRPVLVTGDPLLHHEKFDLA